MVLTGDGESFADRAIGLVDSGVRVGGRTGIRVGDGDPAEGRAAHNIRLFALGPVGVEQRVELIGIAVRPAIDRDPSNVLGRVESARPQRALKLVAYLLLEGFERGGEQLHMAGAVLR